MKLAIASLAVIAAIFLAGLIGAGVLAVRGAASATAWALETAQPVIEAAPGMTQQVVERVDGAVAALRAGRVDGAAVRKTLGWLPGALIDGRLDADEVALLEAKLDRILGPAAGPEREGTAAPTG